MQITQAIIRCRANHYFSVTATNTVLVMGLGSTGEETNTAKRDPKNVSHYFLNLATHDRHACHSMQSFRLRFLIVNARHNTLFFDVKREFVVRK